MAAPFCSLFPASRFGDGGVHSLLCTCCGTCCGMLSCRRTRTRQSSAMNAVLVEAADVLAEGET